MPSLLRELYSVALIFLFDFVLTISDQAEARRARVKASRTRKGANKAAAQVKEAAAQK